ncbi:hypothetical protein CEXT_742971 [Caerostris extrusa]|uniref:Uncharacterized protein n=1 Tax=Caerostris extrusa TaxID=172846 RepID=A0AAV4W0G3_CAEEX|nr:hypothetical protein CEXT_742971 [Caerostris extrusa]
MGFSHSFRSVDQVSSPSLAVRLGLSPCRHGNRSLFEFLSKKKLTFFMPSFPYFDSGVLLEFCFDAAFQKHYCCESQNEKHISWLTFLIAWLLVMVINKYNSEI